MFYIVSFFLISVIAYGIYYYLNSKWKNNFEELKKKSDLLQKELNSVKIPAVSSDNGRSERLQIKLNNLQLVNELSRRITSSLSIEESFSYLYQTINSMMDATVVELVVYGEDDTEMFFSNEKYKDDNLRLESYNHLSEWSFKNDKPVFLEDAESDFGRYVSKPLKLPDGKSAKSLMCFPVKHLEKITGTLCIISFTKNAFESFHREIIVLMLPFLGVAIDNAFKHQQLIELKKRAERSEQFMQVFLANMSHEIRTPMNAVMGMTNLLLQKNPQPEQLKYLNTIQRSSENLLVILNDILDLSKIEAGKIEIEKIDFPIFDVVNNLKEIIQFKAEEKGLALSVQIDPEISPVLTGDPTRLTQVLLNLLSNAVKFTEKGSVKLVVHKSKVFEPDPESLPVEQLNFLISDTGIGMSKEQQQKLFQDYAQASIDTTRKYGGTGLGLSISKQLVGLQGGTIEVESEPGKGSTFSFFLKFPVSRNATIASKEADVSESMLERLNGLRILLVDDNEYNRIVIKETLTLKIPNVKVDEAIDGLIALNMLSSNNYDVVMMDLVMPKMDGYETTSKIRHEFPAEKNSIPIIAITASVQKREIEKCFAGGMNGFIPKPFKTQEVLASIYNVLFGKHENNLKHSADSKSSPGKLIDPAYLREISDGDTERMKRYAELFIVKAPESVSELRTALQDSDLNRMRIAAHNMKSMLKFNGILSGYEMAEIIEQNCIQKTDLEQLPVLIEELHTVCSKAISELRLNK